MSEARTVGPATRIDIDNDYVAVVKYQTVVFLFQS
jgi:hypothetical protein